MGVEGAVEIATQHFDDKRGTFLEWFHGRRFEEALDLTFPMVQANCSVSNAGVLRGIHFADVPPGQAKYVTCVRGAVFDVVVDLRTGSPSFGHWDAVVLDDNSRNAVYLAEGLGHAFLSLEDDSTVVYLCSTPYTPDREHEIDALDPGIGIAWPTVGRDGVPLQYQLSPKDEAAPSLADAVATGLCPEFSEVRKWIATK